jgi:hypothetical protein
MIALIIIGILITIFYGLLMFGKHGTLTGKDDEY